MRIFSVICITILCQVWATGAKDDTSQLGNFIELLNRAARDSSNYRSGLTQEDDKNTDETMAKTRMGENKPVDGIENLSNDTNSDHDPQEKSTPADASNNTQISDEEENEMFFKMLDFAQNVTVGAVQAIKKTYRNYLKMG